MALWMLQATSGHLDPTTPTLRLSKCYGGLNGFTSVFINVVHAYIDAVTVW